jgi:hypothetical protein
MNARIAKIAVNARIAKIGMNARIAKIDVPALPTMAGMRRAAGS